MSCSRKIERFNKKYAHKGGFKRLKEMVDNMATLEEIGKEFGFSRQNAAGLYQSFFNKSYKNIQHNRSNLKYKQRIREVSNLDERLTNMKKRGRYRSYKKTLYLKSVKDNAEKHNYDVKVVATKSFSPNLIINGYNINVCGTDAKTIYHLPKSGEPTIYYRFAISSRKHDFTIFVLEYEPNRFTYYIIPYNDIKSLSLITLRVNYDNPRKRGKNGSKYLKYRNAWHLLKK